MQIEDGKGRGFKASISESNRLNVSSKSNPRLFYISRDDELAFVVTSVDAGPSAGDVILYIKNSSPTRNLFVDQITVSADTASLWKAWTVTGTAAGSTALTSTNLNLGSSLASEELSRGDGAITGLTLGEILGVTRNTAGSHASFDFRGGLLLGPNKALGVEYDTGSSTAAEVVMVYHFEGVTRAN